MMKEVQYWLNKSQLKEIYTSKYWNDIEEEKKKHCWIEDGDYEKYSQYLKTTGLLEQYRQSIPACEGKSLKIADLGAGIGWTSALLSRLENVAEVHCVDISVHRFERLFKHSVKMWEGQEHKIHRYIGSFYDLHFDSSSIDIVYLSQAFHHADESLKLLIECDRVLTNRGRIILVGEHYIGFVRWCRRFIKNLVVKRKMAFSFYELFKPDPVLGDHYYRLSDYQFMFQSLGYGLRFERTGANTIMYVADKAV